MSQSSAQYSAFIKEIVSSQKVWTIFDKNGIPAPKNLEGDRSMPFWSSENKANSIIKNVKAYNDFVTQEISLHDFLDKWITGLENDNLLVGVNWTGLKATGYDLRPKVVLMRINYELTTK